MYKILPLVFLFLGETLAIYAEIMAAKNINNFNFTFGKMSLLMVIGGIFLIAGYMFGIKYLQNIWIVSAVSIASIIIMEPVITFLIFKEIPSGGALIGLIFGVVGLLSALFIK